MKVRLLYLIPVLLSATVCNAQTPEKEPPPAIQVSVGESVVTTDGGLRITNIGNIRGYGKNADTDIFSPKSAGFSKDGKKLYVNSLEGGKTVVYDGTTRKKLKTIRHRFNSGKGSKWLKPSGYYQFTHYEDGESQGFMGKPVEQALTTDGRYLFVPYYRRTFDINAQDPSAMAVIDTRTDSIILMTETGPLPKMVKVSNDGKMLAITHWGDNTVGFMDISDGEPAKWKHLPPVIIGYKHKLDYSLEEPVNRDSGSGFSLRGTVFLPGDSLLLVGAMGGPAAVVDVKKSKFLGFIYELPTIRHIAMRGDMLYLSNNSRGSVMTVPVAEILKGVKERQGKIIHVKGIRNVKVGAGARTLEVSPDGKYIFVACNGASAVYIVDSSSMNVVGSIDADSYPVGLDISPKGDILVTTSQGRSKKGGNAVNIYSLEYLK